MAGHLCYICAVVPAGPDEADAFLRMAEFAAGATPRYPRVRGVMNYRAGKYDECTRLAEAEIAGGDAWNERWRVLKISAQLQRGQYAEAMETLRVAVRRFPAS